MNSEVRNLTPNPSYNDGVVMEPHEMMTTLDQYWLERESAYAKNIEHQDI